MTLDWFTALLFAVALVAAALTYVADSPLYLSLTIVFGGVALLRLLDP